MVASERAHFQGSLSVAKAELGEKQACPSCGAKFYDLRKRPATCPKCGFSFDPNEESVKIRRAKSVRTPNYERDDEEEETERVETDAEEGFEEEVEATPELDAEGAEETLLSDDEDADPTNPDALPAGFSEEEVELEDETPVDDEAPILDLEEDEEFVDEELSEIGDADEDEEQRR
jgi:uncharacterized protein (TIGR02300 family)